MIFHNWIVFNILDLWNIIIWNNFTLGIDSKDTNCPDKDAHKRANEEEEWYKVDSLVLIQKFGGSIDHINCKLKVREATYDCE